MYPSDPVTNPNRSTGSDEVAVAGDKLATTGTELGDISARTSPTLFRDISLSLLLHLASTMIYLNQLRPKY